MIRKVLPLKSNLAMAQAATRPNTRLRPTEIAATSKRQPDRSQRLRLGQRGEIGRDPFEKACANTTTSGSTTKTERNRMAAEMMTMRTAFGSVRRLPRAAAACARAFASDRAIETECVDLHRHRIRPQCAAGTRSCAQRCSRLTREDDDEGHDEHDHRDGGRVGITEFGQPDHDQERRDLGDVGQIARDEDHRAVFADGAREGEREAREQGPASRLGRMTRVMVSPAAGPRLPGGLLDLGVEILRAPAAPCAPRRGCR